MTKVKTPLANVEAFTESASVSFKTNLEKYTARHNRQGKRHTFAHVLASPLGYEENYQYPLIIWLHDLGKTESEIFEVLPKLSVRNYVAVSPKGISTCVKRVARSQINGRLVNERRWSENVFDWPETEEALSEAENLVFDSLSIARQKYNVNPRRVFLVGHGSGGTMALRIALRTPREFTGVVSIDGPFPTLIHLPFRAWREARELPILMTAGGANSAQSPTITPETLRLFHTAGMTVTIRQYRESVSKKQGLAEARMQNILRDVNAWIMEREWNPQTPLCEYFKNY